MTNISFRPIEFSPLPLFQVSIKSLGQTGSEIKKTVAGAMMIPLAITSAAAYVGFKLASKEDGFPAFLGYGVGALGALGAISSLLVTIGVLKTPIPAITAPAADPGSYV